MADIEAMLRDTCAADQPLWSCRAITVAEYESCLGARDRAVCAAMERHAVDCRVREQIRARCPLRVAKVEPGSPAEAAGLRVDDRITAVGDTPLGAEEASVLIDAVSHATGAVRLTFTRAGVTSSMSVMPTANAGGVKRIGVGFSPPAECASFLPKMKAVPCIPVPGRD
jgi:membrane-associated protease RseP (regulator of RpoE activity)